MPFHVCHGPSKRVPGAALILFLAELHCSPEYDVLVTVGDDPRAGFSGVGGTSTEGGASVGAAGLAAGTPSSAGTSSPATECFGDTDCADGEVCYAGQQCPVDCTDPRCCLGNQCSPSGCGTTAPLSCALVGCPSGAECITICQIPLFPPACECTGQGWYCSDGSLTGTAGAPGGTSAGGTSAGGTSAGSTSAGGTSAGSTSAGGTSGAGASGNGFSASGTGGTADCIVTCRSP